MKGMKLSICVMLALLWAGGVHGHPSFAAVCTINSIKVVKYQQISAK